jgi:hypothetical protein
MNTQKLITQIIELTIENQSLHIQLNELKNYKNSIALREMIKRLLNKICNKFNTQFSTSYTTLEFCNKIIALNQNINSINETDKSYILQFEQENNISLIYLINIKHEKNKFIHKNYDLLHIDTFIEALKMENNATTDIDNVNEFLKNNNLIYYDGSINL